MRTLLCTVMVKYQLHTPLSQCKKSPITGGFLFLSVGLRPRLKLTERLLTGQTPQRPAGGQRHIETQDLIHRLLEFDRMSSAEEDPHFILSQMFPQQIPGDGNVRLTQLVLLQREVSTEPVTLLPLQPILPFNPHPGHKVRIVGDQQQGAQIIGQHLDEQLP